MLKIIKTLKIAKPGSSEHQTGLAIDFCVYEDDKCYIEDEVKDNACLNMFIITPELKGVYSFAEAVECVNNGSKVFFAIYDAHKQFDTAMIKSIDAIGSIIEKHGGTYEKYFEEDMDAIVRDVIASL